MDEDHLITMIEDQSTMIIAMNPVVSREPEGIFSKWFSASSKSGTRDTQKSRDIHTKESVTLSNSTLSGNPVTPARRRISIRKQNESKEDEGQIGKGLAEMAEAQANLCNWEKAFELWDQALQLQKEKLGPHHLIVASTRARRARAFSDCGQWYPAALDLGKAAHIFQGQDDTLASDAYMKLAIAQDRMGHFDEAITNMKTALELKEKIQDQVGIARLHCLLGNVYQQQRDYKSAMESYRLGLECYERAGVPKDHPDVMWATRRASDRNMLGHIFWRHAGEGSS